MWLSLDAARLRRLLWQLCWASLPLPVLAAPEGEPDCRLHPLQPMLVQVRVNDTLLPQDQLMVRDGCGAWYWPLNSKQQLPLNRALPSTPVTLSDGKAYLPLAELAETARFDDVQQQLQLTLPTDRLDRHLLAVPLPRLDEVTPANLNGVYLDYDALTTQGNGSNQGWGVNLFVRAFGPWGGLQQSGVIRQGQPYTGLNNQQLQSIRLDSTYTYDEYRSMWKLRVGDAVSQAFESGLPIRFAGVQLARDFSLQPGFLPFPMQSITGSSALPSTLDVYVNDTLTYSANLPPGPFELSQLPAISADGVVNLQVRDTLGRVNSYQTPLLSLTRLLAPGLWDYAFQAGRERLDYGYASHHYGAGFASAGYRYGLSAWLTLDGRAEASHGGGLIGLGVVGRLGSLGTVTLNDAQSQRPDSGRGSQYSIGYEWSSQRLSAGWQQTRRSRGFRQLGMASDPDLEALLSNSGYLGLRAGPVGLTLAYTDRCYVGNACQSTSSFSGSVPLPYNSQFYVTLSESRNVVRRYGVFTGLTIPLDPRQTVAASYSSQDHQASSTLSYSYTDYDPLSRSAQLAVQRNGNTDTRLLGTGRIDTRYATLQMDVDQSQLNGTLVRFGARGSLIGTMQQLGATRQVGDGFAVVNTGGQPNVPITLENQVVAQSNVNGMALVPNLYGYQANRIGIDTSRLPIDYQVPDNSRTLVPQRGNGYQLDFTVKRGAPGRVIDLTLPAGWQLSDSSEGWHDGVRQDSLALSASRLYLSSAPAGDYLIKAAPDRLCRFKLPAEALVGTINRPLGPLACRADAGASTP